MNKYNELRKLFTVKTTEGETRCEFHAQLERSDYKLIADALARIDGHWSKRDNACVFQYDASDDIEEIFRTGQLPKRNPLQLHPTPRQQVLDMIESSEALFAKLVSGQMRFEETGERLRMLEPSIGRCGIADVVRELYPHVDIYGVELDSINAKLAQAKGYNVTHGDFLEHPVPATEEDRFDVIIMNPPFMGRTFIKHVRHAQKMLKKNGHLVSVIPFEWMKSAQAKNETEFLDEISRTSSILREAYPAGTYETTDCVTCIAELMHPDAYQKRIAVEKDYWLHVSAIEIENDEKFRRKFDAANVAQQREMLQKELVRMRNEERAPSVVDWLDEMMEHLTHGADSDEQIEETDYSVEDAGQIESFAAPALENSAQMMSVDAAVEPPAQQQQVEVEIETEKFVPAAAAKIGIIQSVVAKASLPKLLPPTIFRSCR